MHWSTQYLGLPWVTGGRDIEKGLDCWGLLHYFYRNEYGLEINEHHPALGHLAPARELVKEELESSTWWEVQLPQEGDAVALGQVKNEFIHVGIFLELDGQQCILHTARKSTSLIMPLRDLKRQGWLHVKFYRHVDRFTNP